VLQLPQLSKATDGTTCVVVKESGDEALFPLSLTSSHGGRSLAERGRGSPGKASMVGVPLWWLDLVVGAAFRLDLVVMAAGGTMVSVAELGADWWRSMPASGR
jgi:hypothetical protein